MEGDGDIGRAGLVRLWDQERGVETLIDLGSAVSRERYLRLVGERDLQQEAVFKRHHVDWIDIDTENDYVKPLNFFFRARAKRR